MTGSIGYADPSAAAPTLGPVGLPPRPDDQQRLTTRVRVALAVPAVVSTAAHLLFGVAYWVPETSAFPAHDWWLTQLSPLVSPTLTSAGAAQVAAQQDAFGIGGGLLLACGLALLVLARHPHHFGQGALLVPAGAGALVAVVAGATVMLGGRPGDFALGLLLLAVWVGCAGYGALYGLLVDLAGARPRRWRNGVPLLLAYALVGPVPVAVGRALFGGELRDAAASLQGNSVALRLAGLSASPSFLLYLGGLLVGVSVWAAYQCWPVTRDTGMLARMAVLVTALVFTAATGATAADAAQRRAGQLRGDSAAGAIHFSCGSAQLGPREEARRGPARTLVVSGLTCRTVTAYEGHRQLATRTLPDSSSPLTATGTDGRRLSGRLVGAQYDDVLVLAATSRLDTGADRLVAVGVGDAALRWQFSCLNGALRLRFAGVPGGDDRARGHITEGERQPQVIAVCDGQTDRLDPATGRRTR